MLPRWLIILIGIAVILLILWLLGLTIDLHWVHHSSAR